MAITSQSKRRITQAKIDALMRQIEEEQGYAKRSAWIDGALDYEKRKFLFGN